MNKLLVKIGMFAAIISLASCGSDSSPGYEFMPNMYRSPSLETYGDHIVLNDTSYMIEGYNGMPVEGTIAQGHLSTFNYSEDQYDLAGSSATYPSTFVKDDKTMVQGEDLYVQMCAHCHGTNGDGKGTITHAVYSAVPSYSDSIQIRRTGSTMNKLTEGHLLHTITYGLNAMGPHASQISEEERWKIVYYIQENLQNN